MSSKRILLTSFSIVLSGLLSTIAFADSGQGMTWSKLSHNSTLGIDQVSCNDGASDGCNAYHGDTSCLLSRPILCIKVDGSSRPNYTAVGSEFYDGWAGGYIATTLPVQVLRFTSTQTPISSQDYKG